MAVKFSRFLVLSLLVLASCNDSGAPAPAVDPVVAGVVEKPLPPSGEWLSGDLHSHSTYSKDAFEQGGDGVGKVIEISEAVGFDFLVISDHRTLEQTRDENYSSDSMILIPGEEWGTHGHAGAFGIESEIPLVDWTQPVETYDDQVQAAIQTCLSHGGAWTINHPSRGKNPWIWSTEGASGVEVWNSFWTLVSEDARVNEIDDFIADGVEVNEAVLLSSQMSGVGGNRQGIVFWETLLNKGQRLAAVGGSDRHMVVLPGLPTTRVFAEESTQEGVVEAIKLGRTYITYKPDGPVVEFDADGDGDGMFETIVGGEVPHGSVSFRAQITDSIGGKVQVIKNGTLFKSVLIADGDSVEWSDDVTEGDWYRVDFLERAETTDLPSIAWKEFVLSRPMQDIDLESFEFYLKMVFLAASYQGLDLDFDYGTKLPTLLLRDDFLRLANIRLDDPQWAQAAMTSPIYAVK